MRKGAERLIETEQKVCKEEDSKRLHESFRVEEGDVPELREVALNQASLEEFKITGGEVRKRLLQLDVAITVGPYRISLWLLKEGPEILCLPFFMVYNRSLATGELTESWKTANATLI